MKRFLIILMFLVGTTAYSQDIGSFNLETQIAGTGTQGTILVKAWGIGRKLEAAKLDAKRNAVYATIFSGFRNTDTNLSSDLRPMVSDPAAWSEHSDYFNSFFSEGGNYLRFVSFIDGTGEVESGDVLRVKRKYKVRLTLVVNKDALTKELERAEIVKPFALF